MESALDFGVVIRPDTRIPEGELVYKMINSEIIAVTGGIASGKSTVIAELKARYGGNLGIIPEVATIILAQMGLDQRSMTVDDRRRFQVSVYREQVIREDLMSSSHRIIVTDRGTVDGGSFWPGDVQEFWGLLATSHTRELERYRAVLWLESAAVIGCYDLAHNNPFRTQTALESISNGKRNLALWQGHPQLYVVQAERDFKVKRECFHNIFEKLLSADAVGPKK